MWNEFSFVLSAVGFLLSLAAAVFAAQAAVRRQELRELRRLLAQSPTQSLARSVSALDERLTETQNELSLLANRFKMSKVRAATTHTDGRTATGEPDPQREPDRWREWMNAKLSRKRLGVN